MVVELEQFLVVADVAVEASFEERDVKADAGFIHLDGAVGRVQEQDREGCRAPGGGSSEESPPAPIVQPCDPPMIDVGLNVDQAYAAIPHRRTVWVMADSTVPPAEADYLRVIFAVMDQGVAVRVAGQQNFSAGQFEGSDPVANYDRLIEFARGMPVPGALAAYHQKVLDGLAGQRQFFADWKAERQQFRFAQQIGEHPGARNASAALRAAYNELMAKYPNETATNKDAFFDFHWALDFL